LLACVVHNEYQKSRIVFLSYQYIWACRYISSVIPIGAMFAMTLWLGNSAYLYISVAFAQMLKAIMPVAVFLLGAAFGLEEMSCKMLAIIWVELSQKPLD
jgi:hypothetical protein